MLNGHDTHELVRRLVVAAYPRVLTAPEVAESSRLPTNRVRLVLADLVAARRLETVCVATAEGDETGYTVGVMVRR